jgi:hypothetical protein
LGGDGLPGVARTQNAAQAAYGRDLLLDASNEAICCHSYQGISEAMMQEIIKYLRDVAQTCSRLARACPDLATARGLEEVALDLMAKARELDQLQL